MAPGQTIPAAFAEAVLKTPEVLAVIDGDHRLTYKELQRRVEQITSSMRDLGVRPGASVAIWMENRWEWIAAALAAQLLRAAIVPVNTRFKGEEVADVLRRSRAVMLVSTGVFLEIDFPKLLQDVVGSDLGGLPDLKVVVTTDPGPEANGCLTWRQLTDLSSDKAQGVIALAEEVQPNDVCDILFTSGTTGFPKGVLSTHKTTLAAHRSLAALTGLRAGDRYLVINPFFHAFGYKAGWMAALVHGCTVLPAPTLDVQKILDLIEKERVTVFPGPPALYQTILEGDAYRGRDLSSLRMAITGASQVAPGFVARVRTELGFEHVFAGYGLTEAAGVGTMGRPGDNEVKLATTNGRAIPGVELQICDADGRALPSGEAGEVRLRGFNMLGYLDDPAATREVLDAEGWLRTGDIGSVDEEGYLVIHDRLKDIVIVGGFNVYPAEVERALRRHPGVQEVAVVGLPDARLGEVVCAYVVPTNPSIRASDILAWSKSRLANFKSPRIVQFVASLPKTANGKVRKGELRVLAETGKY
jgi:acyl-CoA synthetase (AMP-forming)/AMP-acid ligase II